MTDEKLRQPAFRGLVDDEQLGERAALRLFQDADHSFRVPARTGRTDAHVRRDLLDTLAYWIDTVVSVWVAHTTGAVSRVPALAGRWASPPISDHPDLTFRNVIE
jgi:hypothetical protein